MPARAIALCVLVLNVCFLLDVRLGKKKKVISCPHYSIGVFIYGDLSNERTEMTGRLRFGFLKMGVTSIY